MTQQKICFNQASEGELKLAALRQLAFEEPVSRLARLKKTVQRQLARADRDRVRDLSLLQLAALHGGIFGSRDTKSLIFSLALALEDIRIYSSTAFSPIASMAAAAVATAAESDFLGASSPDLITVAGKVSALLALGPERQAWLTVSMLAAIDWVSAGACAQGDPAWPEAVTEILFSKQFNMDSSGLADLARGDCRGLLAAAEATAACIKSKFRPSLVVLVEGQSELIVLPHFARLCGRPLERMGALVIASGGAKQVARRYLTMKDVLNIPIVCVFDGDAEDSSSAIEEDLRERDGLVALESKELEDCYSYEQLLKILNRQLMHSGQTLSSTAFEIPRQGPRKNALNKLFRARGLGDFDKIAFARSTVDLTSSVEEVPADMIRVIDYVAAIGMRSAGQSVSSHG